MIIINIKVQNKKKRTKKAKDSTPTLLGWSWVMFWIFSGSYFHYFSIFSNIVILLLL